MELKKNHWEKKDIEEFQTYLKTYDNPSRREWSTNLLKTELPVLCIKTKEMKDIINGIYGGNYLEFLDHMVWEYYENTAINGSLIIKTKDFKLLKIYLDRYSLLADNWATCDLLTFDIKGNEKEFFKLSKEYIKSYKPFRRRIGMYILFNYIENEEYVDEIYALLDGFKNEEHYYVNMMNSWLFCELFIKQRDKTLKYLEHHNLNKFTINKGVQKCRESRRVSIEDRDMLLKYKIK